MRVTVRTKPYTERGIRRVPCLRCGQPSRYQWNICSLAGRHGVCIECDIELNRTTLAFMRVPNAVWLADEYEDRVREEHGLAPRLTPQEMSASPTPRGEVE